MAKKPPINKDYLKRMLGGDKPTGQVAKNQVFQKCNRQFSNCGDIGQPTLLIRDYVIPADPKTPEQIRQRSKFQAAAAAWNRLSPSEKADYDKQAKRKMPLTGYNLFVREFLNDGGNGIKKGRQKNGKKAGMSAL